MVRGRVEKGGQTIRWDTSALRVGWGPQGEDSAHRHPWSVILGFHTIVAKCQGMVRYICGHNTLNY